VLDRHDLTDEEWARLEPLLPSQKPQRGGRWADHRTVINGVFWRTRCGLPWRDVPPNYGPWKTVYNRHRRWSADGIWDEVLDQLRRDADVVEGGEWTIGVDAGVVRAHQHAAGARHQPPADVDAEVLAPVEVDTGGGAESQEIRGGGDGHAQPGSAGPLPGWVELQDSPRR
jgi:transposase